MSLQELSIAKNWFTGTTVREINWDNIRSPLISWAGFLLNDINQLRIDTQGSTYSFDNDGNANLAGPIRDWSSGISNLTWTFSNSVTISGALTLSGAVTFSSTATFNGAVTFNSTVAHTSTSSFTGTMTIPCGSIDSSGILLNNALAYRTKDSGGTDRTVVQLDASNILRLQNNSAGQEIRFQVSGSDQLRITPTLVGLRGSVDGYITATQKWYWDGAVNTYTYESSDGVITNVCNATESLSINSSGPLLPNALAWQQKDSGGTARTILQLDGSNVLNLSNASAGAEIKLNTGGSTRLRVVNTFVGVVGIDAYVEATKQLYFDGGVDTSLRESAANVLMIKCGGTDSIQLDASGIVINNAAALRTKDSGGTERNLVQMDGTNIVRLFNNSAGAEIRLQANSFDTVRVTSAFLGVRAGAEFYVESTYKIYYDGGGDTFSYEAAANTLTTVVGGTTALSTTTTTHSIFSNASITSTGEIALARVDPPAAIDKLNSYSGIKASGAVGVTAINTGAIYGYNVASVSVADYDATITIDTDIAPDGICVATIDGTANDYYAQVGAGTSSVNIRAIDNAGNEVTTTWSGMFICAQYTT